jgi:hypothetical protein
MTLTHKLRRPSGYNYLRLSSPRLYTVCHPHDPCHSTNTIPTKFRHRRRTDLIEWTFHERSLGSCKVLHTDTYLDSDSILWNTLAYSSSKAKDTVVSKVSEVRQWCKKGKPPHAPTPSHTTPVLNLAVPPHLTQQHGHNAPFRAILHPPKSLPPVSTHQYNTRLRRIFSACRNLGRNNSKTNSSTPTHPYPDSNPNSKNPNPNSDPDSNPISYLETLQQTLNLDLNGKPLSYSTAKSGPDRLLWTLAEAEEILRLILSGTLLPIHYRDIPLDRLRDIVYYNPVVKQKRNDDGTIKYRVRGTAGGNLLDVPYDVSARTASLDVVKLLLHSTVSDKKQWFTIDIKDFYLGTPLPETRYEYIRIKRKKIPPDSIAAHNLEPLFHNDAVY